MLSARSARDMAADFLSSPDIMFPSHPDAQGQTQPQCELEKYIDSRSDAHNRMIGPERVHTHVFITTRMSTLYTRMSTLYTCMSYFCTRMSLFCTRMLLFRPSHTAFLPSFLTTVLFDQRQALSGRSVSARLDTGPCLQHVADIIADEDNSRPEALRHRTDPPMYDHRSGRSSLRQVSGCKGFVHYHTP